MLTILEPARAIRLRHVLAAIAIALFSGTAAQAQMGPDYWKVHGVASNDTLNIRSGPSTGNRIVARAPNGAVFRNLGCRGEGNARWCHLETPDGRINGWAAGRFLQESGAPRGGGSASNDAPKLHVRHSGEMEVSFSTGCTALYNPAGNRIAAGSSCSRSQLSQAHDAVERYMREHGGGSSASSGGAVALQGSGTVIGGGTLKGSIIGRGTGNYALLVSGDGLVCTAALKHAPGEVASELASIHCSNGEHGLVTVKEQRGGYIANFSLNHGDSGWVIFGRS